MVGAHFRSTPITMLASSHLDQKFHRFHPLFNCLYLATLFVLPPFENDTHIPYVAVEDRSVGVDVMRAVLVPEVSKDVVDGKADAAVELRALDRLVGADLLVVTPGLDRGKRGQ